MGMKSNREKIMMAIMAIVVVLAIWYMLFLTPTNDKIEELGIYKEELIAKNQSLEDQISVYKRWQDQLGLDFNSDDDNFLKIADYNNIVGLTNTLNQIFAPAKSFSLSFADPVKVPEKDAYRRDIQISFVAPDFTTGYEILRSLNDMENGCLVMDTFLSGGEGDSNFSLQASVFEYYNPKSSSSSESTNSETPSEG